VQHFVAFDTTPEKFAFLKDVVATYLLREPTSCSGADGVYQERFWRLPPAITGWQINSSYRS
jgi:hypothetical protein